LPSRRTYIPKADGKQRPLGIAAIEDKIVQAAVVMILTPIYEAEFLGLRWTRSRTGSKDATSDGFLTGDLLELNEVGASNLGVFVDAVEMRFIPEAGAFQVRRPVRAMARPRLLDLENGQSILTHA
jgi:hypothetical protein